MPITDIQRMFLTKLSTQNPMTQLVFTARELWKIPKTNFLIYQSFLVRGSLILTFSLRNDLLNCGIDDFIDYFRSTLPNKFVVRNYFHLMNGTLLVTTGNDSFTSFTTHTELALMKMVKGMMKQKVQEMKPWILFFEHLKSTE